MREAPRPRRLTAPILAFFAVALAACRPPIQDAPPPPAPPAPASAPAPSMSATATAKPASVAGMAFVLIEHVGVLRIESGKVSMVLELPGEESSFWTNIVATPAGELWISDWKGIRVLSPAGGALRTIPLTPGKPLYDRLMVRSPSDAWAVTSDTEWVVMHYDGKQWTPIRRRDQFPGRFDDNKFTAFAVTGDGVWVSSWNGLWRGAGKDWQRAPLPEQGGSPDLFVFKNKLIAGSFDGYFIWEGAAFQKLGWPARRGRLRAVSDAGLGAGSSADNQKVVIGPIDGKGPTAESAKVRGSGIRDLAIDEAGRAWVVTDYALSVFDRAGRLVAEWTPGTLSGFIGSAVRVAVVGAGPSELPPPAQARSWEIVGRMQTYKSRTPLASAALELCPLPDDERGCAGAAFVRRATTGPDGGFRIVDVPDGDFWIHVRPPASEKNCDGLFRESGHRIAPGQQCKPDGGASRVCDLGTLTECLPFEMPPPH